MCAALQIFAVRRANQTPEGRVSECGILCPNTSCRKAYPAALLCNQLTLAIRHHINEYYKVFITRVVSCYSRLQRRWNRLSQS
jgi:hypothetical protein